MTWAPTRDDDWRAVRSLSLGEALARLTERTRPVESRDRYSSTFRAPRKLTFQLDAIVAAGTAGITVPIQGSKVLLSASSHAAARLEVAWDDATAETAWYPIVPTSATRPPGGSSFTQLKLRAQQGVSVPSLAVPVYLLVASTEFDELDDKGRFAQVTPGGSGQMALYLTTLAGAEVAARGSDEGAIAVAGWSGAAYQRLSSYGVLGTEFDSAGAFPSLSSVSVTHGMRGTTVVPVGCAPNPLADAGSNAINALSTYARMAGFNGTTWDRVRTVTPAATVAATAGALDCWARLASWDVVGNTWNRVPAGADGEIAISIMDRASAYQRAYGVTGANADANNLGTGSSYVATQSVLWGVNAGGTGDRIWGAPTNADALATRSTAAAIQAAAIGFLYNGTTFDRARSGVGDVATGCQRVVEAVARTLASSQVSVSTATTIAAANASRKRAVITAHPANTDYLYVGAATVTTANGTPLGPGDSLEITADDLIQGIAASGTQVACLIEETL